MKIAALSDNHTNYDFETPLADVLIHAGDFSFRGEPLEIYDFIEWLNAQPHKHKLWIPGNHELSLEDFPYNIEVIENETESICIHNKEIEIEGIKFFGSAFTSMFLNWAFMHTEKQAKRYWETVPKNIDVLVSHGPPFNILDTNSEGNPCGSVSQYKYIEEIRPKLNIFGHIHECYGFMQKQWKDTKKHTYFYNVSVLNEQYKLTNKVTKLQI